MARPGEQRSAGVSVYRLREKIDFCEINSRVQAYLIIPEDGIYTLELPGLETGFELDGILLNGGDPDLSKEPYSVDISTGSHDQTHLPDSHVRVLHKRTSREVPLVNKGSDIMPLLTRLIAGQTVLEGSGSLPEAVKGARPPLTAPASARPGDAGLGGRKAASSARCSPDPDEDRE